MPELQTAAIQLKRALSKPPGAVWAALTDGIQNWWPKDYYTGPYESIEPQGLRLEPRIGGLFAEDWGDGDGLVWATVIAVSAERLLLMAGDSTSQWGGPNRSFTEFRLKEDGDGTELTLSLEPWGVVSESTTKSMESGWVKLLDCLTAWVEDGVRPERPPTVS